MFLDFQAIKRLASLRDIVNWLGLDLKGNRCQCPVNEGDTREMVFTFDKGLWHCFGCKKKVDPRTKVGGDQIELVAHVLQVEQKRGRQAHPNALPWLHARTEGVAGEWPRLS